ncbi:MAG: hypothetical protein ACYSWQ_12425, partial [Planctomycetota bacterium]
MKPIDNTEDFVRRGKAKATTDPQMDKRVLDDSFAAMDETVAGRSSVARMILESRAAKLATAAAIIIAVGLLIIQLNPPEPAHAPTRNVAKSPAEMLSVMSLNMAYRRGGMDAVDRQCQTAVEMLGPRPEEVTIRT